MSYDEVFEKLKSLSNPKNVAGMARFGINPKNTFGIAIPELRSLAKKIGKDHRLAQKLWDSKIHEARILAGMIDDPNQVTGKQMDEWGKDFDSWDVCDQVCMNLFDKTPFAFQKAKDWTKSPKEFIKRSGFSMMACLAWHDKKTKDSEFIKFFPIIKRESKDERNFVKKSVNWALRQIGKKNKNLNKFAIKTAEEIQKINSKSAKWIANDAIKELQSQTIQKRLR
ncbi:MAG: DNA alkylation repair protein [Candidatus Pacebacteria bacterium]|nr:DNA alkylation repair protein [Candidatus Paceibacterota bacterium]